MEQEHKAPILVIYHADCRDGFGAAWAAHQALGDLTPEGNPVRYIPAHYGDQPPDAAGAAWTYILDFSYPHTEMTGLCRTTGGTLTLLDHHATAQRNLAGIPGCTFDMDRSGAVMAWEYFHPGQPVPEILLYVQDRDLWQWKMPASRDINEALQATPLDFGAWSALNIPTLRRQGERLRRPVNRAIDKTLRQARHTHVLGHSVPSAETGSHVSETAERLLELNPDAPFAAVYHRTEQDGVPATKFSLRSRPGGTDVSAIAAHFGGGGHTNAAGFILPDGDETQAPHS